MPFRRLSWSARSITAELAPRFGELYSQFNDGKEVGEDNVHVAIDQVIERVVPVKVQADINSRLEKRVGAMMQHLVEPAAVEAIRGALVFALDPSPAQPAHLPAS